METLHGPGGYTFLLLIFFNLKIPYFTRDFTQCSDVSNSPLTWLDRKCFKII